MRRDLSRACSSCRLRFSVALLGCPACGRKAIPVPEALERVEAPARAAWLAKWASLLVVAPALGLLLWILFGKSGVDMFHLRSALDVPVMLFSVVAGSLGVSLVLVIPVGLGLGLVALLRRLFGRYIDRRGRGLRVVLDRASRSKKKVGPVLPWYAPLRELRARYFLANRPWRARIAAGSALVLAEVLVELCGSGPSLLFNRERFLGMLGGLLVVNVFVIMLGAPVLRFLGNIWSWAYGYFTSPPALFGFEPHPQVLNDALLARWREGRAEVTGRAEPLTEEERAALGRYGGNAKGPDVVAAARTALAAPFSHKPCLAFRVAGERQAQPLDDADAISFAVVTPEGRRLIVDAADVVVLLPPRGPAYREGAESFLHVLGLPGGDWAAREARLAEGERVRVLGRLASLEVAGGGYRERKRLELLDASDGQPVLIDAPTGG